MEKIRTNHIRVEFLWKEFLEDYDFFKIYGAQNEAYKTIY